MNSLDCDLYQSESEVAEFPSSTLLTLSPLNNGKNQKGLHFVIERSGDPGTYEELRIGVFKGDGFPRVCVADFLVGLNEDGDCRLLSTVGGDGCGGHQVSVFPEKDLERSVVFD